MVRQNCTLFWTTARSTNHQRQSSGFSVTPGSTFILHRHTLPGSTRSSCGFPYCNGNNWTEEYTAVFLLLKMEYSNISNIQTITQNHLYGPKRLIRSWEKSLVFATELLSSTTLNYEKDYCSGTLVFFCVVQFVGQFKLNLLD